MGARAIESAFRGAERQSPPISILACGGGLPLEIARVLSDKGRSTNIVTIKGMADADYTGFPVTSVGIGELGGLLRALKRGGATEMLIAGHAQRPDLRNLKIDFGVITNIATIFRLMRGGDDHVLRQIANLFERNGLAVKSIAELAPELLTPAGVLAGEASPAIMSTADHGLRVIRRLGPFDIGQAVVASGDAILAIEGAEGTNGLIARSTVTHHGDSRFKMLVKAAKPSQDLRVDLPTIGTETIERCVAAGISAIALEAGRSLIVDRAATIRKSEASGIALIG
ncbi:MAG: UDP-2,3-diacylglucosamine diphosphatase LpxI, partial [Alphaproteobacteria bacterium]|nr:UDP-2,3-diacylglucosamine diphosphatase LpxI [Alphaproteobacteria bacterium]